MQDIQGEERPLLHSTTTTKYNAETSHIQTAALGHSYGCQVKVTDGTDSILSRAAKLRTRFRREYRLAAEIKVGCLLKPGSNSVTKAPCDCNWVTFLL